MTSVGLNAVVLVKPRYTFIANAVCHGDVAVGSIDPR